MKACRFKSVMAFTVQVLLVVVLCLDMRASGQEFDSSSGISVKWGLADTSATVGRLFKMHIPSDAFSGNVQTYTIKTSEGLPLPSWLEYNSENNVLEGLPSPKDAGQLFLEVTAIAGAKQASVIFTLFVRDIASHTSGAPLRFKPAGPEFVRCKHKEPETIATMIVDFDMEGIPVSERMALLKKFLAHMDLHEEMVKMIPVGNSPLHDSNALVSGVGDCKAAQTPGTFISWPVGCGQVKEGHFPVLQRLDDDSGNGHMTKVLGRQIIGWHVTNTHIQAPIRKRRQVGLATPVVTPVMPTKTEMTEDTEEKMTRTMVERQSPTFIQPTPTEPPMTKTDEVPETTPKMPEPDPPVKPVEPVEPVKPVEPVGPEEPIVDGCIRGQNPMVKNRLPKINLNVGDVFDQVVPEDTFEDCEVGGTRGLQLSLFSSPTKEIQPDSFLQFDSKNQRIVAMPSEEDIGRYKMNLVAMKADGLLANFEFTVTVKGTRGKKKVNHELSMSVDLDYDAFMADVYQRIQLSNNVASVYGDKDSSNLMVTRMDRGSVVYGYSNKTLASSDCPVEDIKSLVSAFANEDGTISQNAIEKMKPFKLLGATSAPAGACEGVAAFPVVNAKPPPEKKDDDTTVAEPDAATDKPDMDKDDQTEPTDDVARGSKSDDDDGDDVWITTVVPAVVIVVILLIALIIACVLYRKKRKGKMNVEEQNTFINKGAPVIFPNELEDKPSDVTKPLLVEGGAPPPEYHRGTSESPEPNNGNTNNIRNNSHGMANDDGITEMPERPYEPPPPVTASSNNKQPRPTHQQQPFSQPPQILP